MREVGKVLVVVGLALIVAGYVRGADQGPRPPQAPQVVSSCPCGPECACAPCQCGDPAKCVVLVRVQGGSGSGVVVKSEGTRSLIATAKHVAGSGTATVVVGSKTYPARVVATDPLHDLSILEVTASLPAATLGDAPDKGTIVRCIGYPGGGPLVVKSGPVAGVLTCAAHPGAPSYPVLVVNLHPIPGDSGGGMFDASNHLVGITFASSGAGHAVPVSAVRSLVRAVGAKVEKSEAPKAEAVSPYAALYSRVAAGGSGVLAVGTTFPGAVSVPAGFGGQPVGVYDCVLQGGRPVLLPRSGCANGRCQLR